MKYLFARVLLAASVVASAAFAQTPAEVQAARFAGFITSPEYQDYLGKVVQLVEPELLKKDCASIKIIDGTSYDVVDPTVMVKVNDVIRFQSGTYVSVVSVDRCGERTTRRIIFYKKSLNDKFQFAALVPGDFHGNLQLEKDAFIMASQQARIMAPECKDVRQMIVLDTKAVVPMTKDGGTDIWTISACGKIVKARLEYNATKDGMSIYAAANGDDPPSLK